MDGLDEVMSDATIYGVTVDAMFQASDLQDAEDVNAEFSEDNNYPQWDAVGSFDYRMQLPTAFDLSYANVELVDEPDLPGERYKTVEVAEDVGDTDFSDIDSWSDVTDSYGSSEVTLDSTVSSGTVYAISYDVVLTNGEVSAIESAAGGGAGPMDAGNGGLWDKIISIPGGIVAAVLGSSVSRSPAEGRRMSASDALPSGDSPSPNSVLTGTIAFLNGGGQLGTLLQGAIFGTLVSFATGGINIIQSGIALVVAPLDALANTVDQAVASLILAPLGIIETTANTSGQQRPSSSECSRSSSG